MHKYENSCCITILSVLYYAYQQGAEHNERELSMRSLEQMAKETIELYMEGMKPYGGNGFSLEVALKKAKATRIGWDDIFDKVAKNIVEA